MKKVILVAVASTMMTQAGFAQAYVGVNANPVATQEQMQPSTKAQADAALDVVEGQIKNIMSKGDGSISEVQLKVISSSLALLSPQARLDVIDAAMARLESVKNSLSIDANRDTQKFLASMVVILSSVGLFACVMDDLGAGKGFKTETLLGAAVTVLGAGTLLYAHKASDQDLERLNKMASEIHAALAEAKIATANQIQADELK